MQWLGLDGWNFYWDLYYGSLQKYQRTQNSNGRLQEKERQRERGERIIIVSRSRHCVFIIITFHHRL